MMRVRTIEPVIVTVGAVMTTCVLGAGSILAIWWLGF